MAQIHPIEQAIVDLTPRGYNGDLGATAWNLGNWEIIAEKTGYSVAAVQSYIERHHYGDDGR